MALPPLLRRILRETSINLLAASGGRAQGYKIWLPSGPPPLPLLWAFLPAKDSAAARLHKIYLRALWRSRSVPGLARLIAMLTLWPVLTLYEILAYTWRNAEAVRGLTGKSAPRQALEQLWFCARYGFRAWNYYTMELYRPDHAALAAEYMHRYETKCGLYDMLRHKIESPLKNKANFAKYCRRRNLPVTPILVTLKDGAPPAKPVKLPAADLFIKRRTGRGGALAYLMTYADGCYHGKDGTRFDHDALLRHVADLSRTEPYIIQMRERNHPDIADLSPQALATVRVVTAINERGEPEVVRAVFRMGPFKDSVVDNFHAGGIAAPVDLATGKLGQATDYGLAPSVGWLDRHPTTGAAIAGRVLPRWAEFVELSCRAHGYFKDRLIIGWDIALTPNGLLIVEGNSAADVDNIQRPHRAPLGLSRYAEIAIWHLERGTTSRQPAGTQP